MVDNRPDRFIAVEMTVSPSDDLPAPTGMDDFDEIPGDWRVWQPSHFVLVNADDPGQQPGRGILELLSISAASVVHVEHLSDNGADVIGACLPHELDENGVPYDDPSVYEALEGDDESPKHDDVVDQVGDTAIVRTGDMPYSPNRGTERRRLRLTFGIPTDLSSPAKLRYANHDFSLVNLA